MEEECDGSVPDDGDGKKVEESDHDSNDDGYNESEDMNSNGYSLGEVNDAYDDGDDEDENGSDNDSGDYYGEEDTGYGNKSDDDEDNVEMMNRDNISHQSDAEEKYPSSVDCVADDDSDGQEGNKYHANSEYESHSNADMVYNTDNLSDETGNEDEDDEKTVADDDDSIGVDYSKELLYLSAGNDLTPDTINALCTYLPINQFVMGMQHIQIDFEKSVSSYVPVLDKQIVQIISVSLGSWTETHWIVLSNMFDRFNEISIYDSSIKLHLTRRDSLEH